MSENGGQTARTPRTARSNTSRNNTARGNTGRHNKIYRTPPTPPPGELFAKEKSFVLDCNAVSSISTDYSKANPKLGPVIPPYNAQKDKLVSAYFDFHGVDRTLKRTQQRTTEKEKGDPIEGPYIQYFHTEGKGFQYLKGRNSHGAGHSRQVYGGHGDFMTDVKPVRGYHGLYGYRRNTPWLRMHPSLFGLQNREPIYEPSVVEARPEQAEQA